MSFESIDFWHDLIGISIIWSKPHKATNRKITSLMEIMVSNLILASLDLWGHAPKIIQSRECDDELEPNELVSYLKCIDWETSLLFSRATATWRIKDSVLVDFHQISRLRRFSSDKNPYFLAEILVKSLFVVQPSKQYQKLTTLKMIYYH